jgi:hypothetical protein
VVHSGGQQPKEAQMPITRTRASQLLNQREMALYDESRINGLRKLDAKALAIRVTRARTARDRARDLVRRQKLASRLSTGSKRGPSGTDNQRSKDKVELMADILSRFEEQFREVKREDARAAKADGARTKASSTAGDKAAPKKSSTKKAAAKKAAARKSAKTATKQASGKAAKTSTRQATKKSATGASAKSATRRSAADSDGVGTRSAPRKSPAQAGRTASATRRARVVDDSAQDGDGPSGRGAAPRSGRGRTRASADSGVRGEAPSPRRPRKRKLTPEQALAQTRALLEAKQARDAESKPWSDTATDGAADGSVGYQSPAAARRAKRLHAAEIRLPANQGSISTRDRVNQGKRDRRNQGED